MDVHVLVDRVIGRRAVSDVGVGDKTDVLSNFVTNPL